jgi:hypothetical protein
MTLTSLLFLELFIYVAFVAVAKRWLERQPYSKYRLANIQLRTQAGGVAWGGVAWGTWQGCMSGQYGAGPGAWMGGVGGGVPASGRGPRAVQSRSAAQPVQESALAAAWRSGQAGFACLSSRVCARRRPVPAPSLQFSS